MDACYRLKKASMAVLTFKFLMLCAAKYGTPNSRLEEIFRFVPSCRRLGLLHYLMTTTPTITMEEVESLHTAASRVL